MPELRRILTAYITAAALMVSSLVEVNHVRAQELRERKVVDGGEQCVVLFVNAGLADKVRPGLNQFSKDLGKDGYTVYEKVSRFTTPPEVRSYLADLYKRTDKKLAGAILIGDHPRAYQFVTLKSANPKIPSKSEEVISFQYYADLDGIFEATSAYRSPGKHRFSYDVHRGEMNSEIWIGVLPAYKGNLNLTAKAVNGYFTKNHAYRGGKYQLPRAFLQVTEHHKATDSEQHTRILEAMQKGQYAWTPFSNGEGARLYFDSPKGKLTVDKGYADLSSGVADFAVVDAHGSWRSSGKLDIAWVERNPIRTVFYWNNGCASGNLDHPDNFLTAVLYSPKSMVLVAKGTTNDSGGMGTNKNGFFGHNIAAAMSEGKSFGQAMVDHVNEPLREPWATSREFHFATSVVLGDPTLRLRNKE
jgi:hypothetical protein